MELWWPAEGGAVATGERVGKIGDAAAVEGGYVAARECCMGWQRRRMVEIEDENGGCDDGGEGQHSLVFYFVGGLGHKNVVGCCSVNYGSMV